jgi:ABC-type branched-subunit amino acid transport system substrate-binding protein
MKLNVQARSRLTTSLLLCGVFFGSLHNALADDKKYGPGVSDTEIKIGQTIPYSGPMSAWSSDGYTYAAYFKMINAQGGINGRKIDLISLDDAGSPPKSVEQTRKLIESENVFLIFGTVGTPTNIAIQKYLNAKKVPHLFVQSGSAQFTDAKDFPFSVPAYPSYVIEAKVYANYIKKTRPNAKIAIIYQQDTFGQGYLNAFKEGLGADASKMIVREASYEVNDPTVDSQVIDLKGSGADTLFSATTPKFGAQVIRKVADLGWKPLHIMVSQSTSITGVLQPAGYDKSLGLISAAAFKTPGDPQWASDSGVQQYLDFMKKWNPQTKVDDLSAVTGYFGAVLMAQVIKSAGNDLTRENIMKVATNIPLTEYPILLPGVKIGIKPDDYSAFHTLRTQRFDGTRWVMFGDPITVGSASTRN